MALVLKLKPGERMIVNGAVIRNPTDRGLTIHLLNKANVLQARDILLPENAKSVFGLLYLEIQAILLEPETAEVHRESFVRLAASIYAQAMRKSQQETLALITELLQLVGENQIYRALRKLRPAIDGELDLPVDKAIAKAR